MDENYQKDTLKIIKVLTKNKVNVELKGMKHLDIKFTRSCTPGKLKKICREIEDYEIRDLKMPTLIFDRQNYGALLLEQIQLLLQTLFSQPELRITSLKFIIQGNFKNKIDLQKQGTPWNKIWDVVMENLEKMNANSLTLCNSKIKVLDDYFWVSDTPLLKIQGCQIDLCECKLSSEFDECVERHSNKSKRIIFSSCVCFCCSEKCLECSYGQPSPIQNKIRTSEEGLSVEHIGLKTKIGGRRKCRCNVKDSFLSLPRRSCKRNNREVWLSDPFMNSGNPYFDREYNNYVSNVMKEEFRLGSDWF